MPQMDDKVQVYFGRIHPAVWERIVDQPGAIIEKAIAALAEARSSGQVFHYPTSLKTGIRKKIWLTPETAEILKQISAETGAPNTPIILAALDLYLGSPSGAASHPEPSQKASTQTPE